MIKYNNIKYSLNSKKKSQIDLINNLMIQNFNITQ